MPAILMHQQQLCTYFVTFDFGNFLCKVQICLHGFKYLNFYEGKIQIESYISYNYALI